MDILLVTTAHAQDVELAREYINKVSISILNPLISIAFVVAVVVFIWGIIQFINALNGGGDTKEGKSHMIWGIVGMTIMASTYGIITMIKSFTDSVFN
jgi:hypothetical protein